VIGAIRPAGGKPILVAESGSESMQATSPDAIQLPKSWPCRNRNFMQFLRRNRFSLIFLALLIFCSAMVVRQFITNQSKHVELREAFILLFSKGYRPDADRLLHRLMRDLEDLPDKALMDDYQRTLLLVDPTTKQQDNLIWRYHWTVSNEIEKRSMSALVRARKLADPGK